MLYRRHIAADFFKIHRLQAHFPGQAGIPFLNRFML